MLGWRPAGCLHGSVFLSFWMGVSTTDTHAREVPRACAWQWSTQNRFIRGVVRAVHVLDAPERLSTQPASTAHLMTPTRHARAPSLYCCAQDETPMKRCRKQASASSGDGGLSMSATDAAATVANSHVQRLKSFSPVASPIARYVESNDHLAACFNATRVGRPGRWRPSRRASPPRGRTCASST